MKKMNKKGFTLAELLIVIAILAILIAIAIPVFSAQLEKARHSVDDSTARSAKSIAESHYLLEHSTSGTGTTCTFKDNDGNLILASCTLCGADAFKDVTGDAVVSQCSGSGTSECKSGTKLPLSVDVTSGGVVTAKWGS